MVTTFFHWGFHAWAIYAIVGLVLAYFGFRYNLPLTIRSGLLSHLQEKIHGPLGHAVDVFALVGTIFGIATTLGYGVMQLSAGSPASPAWTPRGAVSLRPHRGRHRPRRHLGGHRSRQGVKRLSELNLFSPSCSCCSCWWPAPPSTCWEPSRRTLATMSPL